MIVKIRLISEILSTIYYGVVLCGSNEFITSPIKNTKEGIPSPVINAAIHPIYKMAFSFGLAREYNLE